MKWRYEEVLNSVNNHKTSLKLLVYDYDRLEVYHLPINESLGEKIIKLIEDELHSIH